MVLISPSVFESDFTVNTALDGSHGIGEQLCTSVRVCVSLCVSVCVCLLCVSCVCLCVCVCVRCRLKAKGQLLCVIQW